MSLTKKSVCMHRRVRRSQALPRRTYPAVFYFTAPLLLDAERAASDRVTSTFLYAVVNSRCPELPIFLQRAE